MDTDRTAAHLRTVQDNIVRLGTHCTRIGINQRKILFHRHCKWMVDRHISSVLLRVFKQRELGYPEEPEIVFFKKIQLSGQFQTKVSENIEYHLVLVGCK